MNKTEAEFALILEAMKQRGEILRYEYEGITLRWNGVRYTPDFVVFGSPLFKCTPTIPPKEIEAAIEAMNRGRFVAFPNNQSLEIVERRITLIEVKGAFTKGKFERAIERFRHARTYWPEFAFELHQKTKQGWKQIL